MKYLLAILLAFCFITHSAFSQNTSPAPPLKIISWNIHMLPYMIYWKSKKGKRAGFISEEMLKREYDILVFQEAFKAKVRRKLKRRLKEKYPYHYGPANRKFFTFKTNSGIFIFSNRPLIWKGEVQFDACRGPSCWSRKGAMMLEGEHWGHTFQIVGTHSNGRPQQLNRHQFHQIHDKLLKPNEEEGVVQIICGDMNCSKAETENYEAMLRVFDAEDVEIAGDRQFTSYRKEKIIDYILLRRNGANINKYQRDSMLFGPDNRPELPKYKGGIGYSDHFPQELWLWFGAD